MGAAFTSAACRRTWAPGRRPGAGAERGLDDEAVLVAERVAQPFVDVGEPDGLAEAASARRTSSGSARAPSSSMLISHSRSRSLARRDRAALGASLEPVLDGVLDERLEGQEGNLDRQHLGCDAQHDAQPLAVPGLLEQQVLLDRAELVGERGEVAVAAEGVAGEVGELQQQVAGPLGVGAHEDAIAPREL